MDDNMLFEVDFLGEARIASFLSAGKGFLAGVDSQMIDEVVPLAEKETTVLVVAFQNGHHSVGLGILELKDSIVLSRGQLRLHLQFFGVEGIATLHSDSDFFGD
jgi:hypothetical protein